MVYVVGRNSFTNIAPYTQFMQEVWMDVYHLTGAGMTANSVSSVNLTTSYSIAGGVATLDLNAHLGHPHIDMRADPVLLINGQLPCTGLRLPGRSIMMTPTGS